MAHVLGAISAYAKQNQLIVMSINSSISVCPQRIYSFECPKDCLDSLVEFSEGLVDSQLVKRSDSCQSGSFYLLGEREQDRPELLQLNRWLEQCMAEARDCIVWDQQRFPNLVVTQRWINLSRKLDSHRMHVHPLSILSGVLCLSEQVELDLFVGSIYSLPAFFCADTGESDLLVKQTLQLSRGDMILFPSSLRHGVSEYHGNEKRMTLAFNSFFAGAIGSEHELASLNVDPKVF